MAAPSSRYTSSAASQLDHTLEELMATAGVSATSPLPPRHSGSGGGMGTQHSSTGNMAALVSSGMVSTRSGGSGGGGGSSSNSVGSSGSAMLIPNLRVPVGQILVTMGSVSNERTRPTAHPLAAAAAPPTTPTAAAADPLAAAASPPYGGASSPPPPPPQLLQPVAVPATATLVTATVATTAVAPAAAMAVSSRTPLGDRIVRLNVGGVLYSTTASTLCSKGDSFFSTLTSERFSPLRDETGAYFIDRDGQYFKPILEYLRTGQVVIPKDTPAASVYREAAFYCVPLPPRYSQIHLQTALIRATAPNVNLLSIDGEVEDSLTKFNDGEKPKPLKESRAAVSGSGRTWYVNRSFCPSKTLSHLLECFLMDGWKLASLSAYGKPFEEIYVLTREVPRDYDMQIGGGGGGGGVGNGGGNGIVASDSVDPLAITGMLGSGSPPLHR